MTSNTTFKDLGLSPQVLSALEDLGFEVPTPIQAESIPVILQDSQDLLGFAQTGTGKTAAFSLPVLEKIKANDKHVQALILCPTRELCMQISKDLHRFSKYLPKINVATIYGGSSIRDQIQSLKQGAQVVVGTPGRVRDLVERGQLKLNKLRFLTLDEADDMLDKGFQDDLDAILDDTPDEKQTLLFSATMSPWIQKVAQQKMHQPRQVKVAAQNQGADKVEHKYVVVHAQDRYAALRRLLDVNPDVYGIVFCRTRRQTKQVAAQLMADHYSAEALHGDIDQRDRSATMERFRKRQVQILVATDVAARGIDVDELTHVINFELPDAPETYVHRSGRTGRAGRSGISLSILHMKEQGRLKRIERLMKKNFKAIPVPTGKQICEAQLMSLIHGVKEGPINEEDLAPYLPAIYKELEGFSYEELIKHFVSAEFNRFLKHYSNVKDISAQKVNSRDSKGRPDRSQTRGKVPLARFQIALGKKQGFGPKGLFQLIKKNQSLKSIEIGEIDVQAHVTFFEADARLAQKVLKFMGREKFKGQDLGLKRA